MAAQTKYIDMLIDTLKYIKGEPV